LEVKTSTIPGAGDGLFFMGYVLEDGTRVDTLKKGAFITYYSGYENLSAKEYDSRFPERTSYGFQCNETCLDSGPSDNYPGRYINHKPFSKSNVRWGTTVCQISDRYATPMYALKSIKAGKELFVDYGRQYWKK